MRMLTIGEFCATGSGGTPNRSKEKEYYAGGSIPWVKSGELKGRFVASTEEFITERALSESSAKLLEPGAILIAMYGATVGQVSRLAIPAATNQAICHIYPDKSLCAPDYLYRVLEAERRRLLHQRVGGGQPNISQQIVRGLEVRLPPIAAQRRIVSILDAADELRAKRRKALEELDALVHSAFIDMFGDPVANPKGWDTLDGAEMFCELTYGTSRKSMDASTSASVPVLRIPNIIGGEITWSDLKYAVPTKSELATLSLQVDDLLFVRSNGNPDYIGRCARFAEPSRSPCLFASYLIRGRISKSVGVEAGYLKHHIEFPSYRHEVRKEARTTAGNYNLSTAGIRKFRFMKPPVKLQRMFANVVERVQQQKARNRAHLAELDALFASLQFRAFKGKL